MNVQRFFDWRLENVTVERIADQHAPGQHDQKSHGGGGGKAEVGWDTPVGFVIPAREVFSEEQASALKYYTGETGFHSIQEQAQGKAEPTQDIQQKIAAIDAAIASSPVLEREMVVYRGMRVDKAKMTPGAVFSAKGFTSTDMGRDVAQKFAKARKGSVLRITLPAGTRALQVGRTSVGRSFESEVILPRGSRFRVKDITPNERGRGTNINVELITKSSVHARFEDWDEDITPLVEHHGDGTHDEKSHGGGSGGGDDARDPETGWSPRELREYELKSAMQDEMSAVSDYTNHGYEDVNALLRRGAFKGTEAGKAAAAQVKLLDSAFARSEPLKTDIVVYRVTKVPRTFDQWKVGSVMVDKGYASSTTRIKVAEKIHEGLGYPNEIIQIRVPKGTRVLDLNDKRFRGMNWRGESEVILPRGSRFKVMRGNRGGLEVRLIPRSKAKNVLDAVMRLLGLQHPGHPDQKVHGGGGGSKSSDKEEVVVGPTEPVFYRTKLSAVKMRDGTVYTTVGEHYDALRAAYHDGYSLTDVVGFGHYTPRGKTGRRYRDTTPNEKGFYDVIKREAWRDHNGTGEAIGIHHGDHDQKSHGNRDGGDVTDTADHPSFRDNGDWGASHGNSRNITGYAARAMGEDGWDVLADRTDHNKTAERFLQGIADDKAGSEEALYHGWLNKNWGEKFEPGDTLTLPLASAAGDLSDSVGFGVGSGPSLADYQREKPGATREDLKNTGYMEGSVGSTVFKFPVGTPMIAYGKWKKADAKDFGYRYTEAIVSGKFKVVSVERKRGLASAWWDPEVEVVTLEPTHTFDPSSKRWRATKTKRLG